MLTPSRTTPLNMLTATAMVTAITPLGSKPTFVLQKQEVSCRPICCVDEDGDGTSDANDDFLGEPTQWTDSDGMVTATTQRNATRHVSSTVGTSTVDRFGCIDGDSDGVSDEHDLWPTDDTQWYDSDGTRTAITSGTDGDACPNAHGMSTQGGTFGCPTKTVMDGQTAKTHSPNIEVNSLTAMAMDGAITPRLAPTNPTTGPTMPPEVQRKPR